MATFYAVDAMKRAPRWDWSEADAYAAQRLRDECQASGWTIQETGATNGFLARRLSMGQLIELAIDIVEGRVTAEQKEVVSRTHNPAQLYHWLDV